MAKGLVESNSQLLMDGVNGYNMNRTNELGN
jgi:hypothetical protein